ncbi:phosphoethanolamine transferase [Pandoraea terrae]|uniref:phosphoethanolamine transferase n=1 Tax=Pandoraea terrae TaxID=1537710 RepID=UPI001781401E|nr:phosphoethanolamine transferase [Pandoraea terrae]
MGLTGSLQAAYGLSLESPTVLTALGNTHWHETKEFLASLSLLWSVLFCVWFALFYTALWRLGQPRAEGWRLEACVLITIFGMLHLNPTAREKNPIFGWTKIYTRNAAFRDDIAKLTKQRNDAAIWLAAQPVKYVGPSRRTVVLVLGESINRTNWQIHGYLRETSPRLSALRDELLVMNDVVSSEGTTVASIRSMLTLGTDEMRGPGVTALARLAGYKTYWLTNQVDRYLWGRFASEADFRAQTNSNDDGRRGRSLDEALQPLVSAALSDPAPHKFIVVHMLGAHPHYDLRYPATWAFFQDDDPIDAQLISKNRWPWIRNARKHYDRAMRYHDAQLGDIIDRLRQLPAGEAALLYTADHGQEVGHTRNFAGHAPGHIAGHAVPMIVWPRSESRKANMVESRAYSTSRLEGTLASLLRIETPLANPADDVLGEWFRDAPRFIGTLPYPG